MFACWYYFFILTLVPTFYYTDTQWHELATNTSCKILSVEVQTHHLWFEGGLPQNNSFWGGVDGGPWFMNLEQFGQCPSPPCSPRRLAFRGYDASDQNLHRSTLPVPVSTLFTREEARRARLLVSSDLGELSAELLGQPIDQKKHFLVGHLLRSFPQVLVLQGGFVRDVIFLNEQPNDIDLRMQLNKSSSALSPFDITLAIKSWCEDQGCVASTPVCTHTDCEGTSFYYYYYYIIIIIIDIYYYIIIIIIIAKV
jgi:hypothetical protein